MSLYIFCIADNSIVIVQVEEVVCLYKLQNSANSLHRWICDRCRRQSSVHSCVVDIVCISDILSYDAWRTLLIWFMNTITEGDICPQQRSFFQTVKENTCHRWFILCISFFFLYDRREAENIPKIHTVANSYAFCLHQ